jgi:hypothetical protein
MEWLGWHLWGRTLRCFRKGSADSVTTDTQRRVLPWRSLGPLPQMAPQKKNQHNLKRDRPLAWKFEQDGPAISVEQKFGMS